MSEKPYVPIEEDPHAGRVVIDRSISFVDLKRMPAEDLLRFYKAAKKAMQEDPPTTTVEELADSTKKDAVARDVSVLLYGVFIQAEVQARHHHAMLPDDSTETYQANFIFDPTTDTGEWEYVRMDTSPKATEGTPTPPRPAENGSASNESESRVASLGAEVGQMSQEDISRVRLTLAEAEAVLAALESFAAKNPRYSLAGYSEYVKRVMHSISATIAKPESRREQVVPLVTILARTLDTLRTSLNSEGATIETPAPTEPLVVERDSESADPTERRASGDEQSNNTTSTPSGAKAVAGEANAGRESDEPNEGTAGDGSLVATEDVLAEAAQGTLSAEAGKQERLDITRRYLDGLDEKERKVYRQAWDTVRDEGKVSMGSLAILLREQDIRSEYVVAIRIIERLCEVGLVSERDTTGGRRTILQPEFVLATDEELQAAEENPTSRVQSADEEEGGEVPDAKKVGETFEIIDGEVGSDSTASPHDRGVDDERAGSTGAGTGEYPVPAVVEADTGAQEAPDERTPWQKARAEYKVYSDEMKQAGTAYKDAIKKYELEKKNTTLGMRGAVLEKNALRDKRLAMEEAERAYDTLLNQVREKRTERIHAFAEERVARGIAERATRIITVIPEGEEDPRPTPAKQEKHMFAVHEALLIGLTNKHAEVIERLRGIGVEKERGPLMRGLKAAADYYRKIPVAQKFGMRVIGAGAIGAGAAFLAAPAAVGAALWTGGAAATRAAVGFFSGMGAAAGTKKGLDALAKKYVIDKKTNALKENFSETKLSDARKRTLGIRRWDRNLQRASTATAGAAAFGAGATAGQAAAHVVDSGFQADSLTDAEAWKGVPNALERMSRAATWGAEKLGLVDADVPPTAPAAAVPEQAHATPTPGDQPTSAPEAHMSQPEALKVPTLQSSEQYVSWLSEQPYVAGHGKGFLDLVDPSNHEALYRCTPGGCFAVGTNGGLGVKIDSGNLPSPYRNLAEVWYNAESIDGAPAPTAFTRVAGVVPTSSREPLYFFEGETEGGVTETTNPSMFGGLKEYVRAHVTSLDEGMQEKVANELYRTLATRDVGALSRLGIGVSEVEGQLVPTVPQGGTYTLSFTPNEVLDAVNAAHESIPGYTGGAAAAAAAVEQSPPRTDVPAQQIAGGPVAAEHAQQGTPAGTARYAADPTYYDGQMEPFGERPPLAVRGTYADGASVERVLQNNISADPAFSKLTHEELGKVAHRVQLELMKDPDMAEAFGVQHGHWDEVAKGGAFNAEIDRSLIEREIAAVRGVSTPLVEPSTAPSTIEAPTPRPEHVPATPVESPDARAISGSYRSADFPRTAELYNNLENLRQTGIDHLGASSRPALDHLFKTHVFTPELAAMRPQIQSAWGVLSKAPARLLIDRVPGSTFAVGGTTVTLTPDTERLLTALTFQLEKIPGARGVLETVAAKNGTYGDAMNEIARLDGYKPVPEAAADAAPHEGQHTRASVPEQAAQPATPRPDVATQHSAAQQEQVWRDPQYPNQRFWSERGGTWYYQDKGGSWIQWKGDVPREVVAAEAASNRLRAGGTQERAGSAAAQHRGPTAARTQAEEIAYAQGVAAANGYPHTPTGGAGGVVPGPETARTSAGVAGTSDRLGPRYPRIPMPRNDAEVGVQGSVEGVVPISADGTELVTNARGGVKVGMVEGNTARVPNFASEAALHSVEPDLVRELRSGWFNGPDLNDEQIAAFKALNVSPQGLATWPHSPAVTAELARVGLEGKARALAVYMSGKMGPSGLDSIKARAAAGATGPVPLKGGPSVTGMKAYDYAWNIKALNMKDMPHAIGNRNPQAYRPRGVRFGRSY